ncbi:hypothetical protein [Bacillus sp. T33-2]|uniref:hypothetical protein n=1 Tax=Bacillus sp. T33-2 TaxID=2054168 RepID=UPI0015E0C854|nr:hypothetical protein [Bacillus sp. T33-2]
MSGQHEQKAATTPGIKGAEKVIKTSPELAGMDDRTTLNNNRSGDDMQDGATRSVK